VTEFADVAKARASYKVFRDAMNAGRDIMRRAGVADAPEVPDFDVIFRRMTPELKQELYAALNQAEISLPAEVIRFWQPFIRRAFTKA
jgi:hypothetical protein